MVALSEFHAKEVEPLLNLLVTMDRGLDEELISTVSHNSTRHTRKQCYKTLKSAEQDEVCSLYNPSRGNAYRFIDIRQHIANELKYRQGQVPMER